MPNRDPSQFRPALTGLVGNCREPRLNLFGPRLVIDMSDAGGAIGMVADEAAKNHHCSATWKCNPVGSETDLERLVGQRDPIVGCRWLKSHSCPS